jgi:hypothetical protein
LGRSRGEDFELFGDKRPGIIGYHACRLRIMWIISMPDRMTAALACDVKPGMDRMRRLMRQ